MFYENDCSYGNNRDNEAHYFAQFHGNDDNPNSNIWIWNNLFHDDDFGAIDNLNFGSNWYIWNNVFYNLMRAPGMHGSVINVPCTNTHVTHNSFYNNRESGQSREWVAGVNIGSNGNNVHNNIFFNVGDDADDDDGAIRSTALSGNPTHNYIYSSNRGDSSCAGNCHPADSTDVTTVHPGWIDEQNKDFHLAQSSDCINKGVTISDSGYYTPSIDKDGNERGSQPDIGAHEYTGSTPSPPLVGDVNNNGTVDIQDIQACINHLLGVQDYGTAADVNQDGNVNVLDVQEIVNIVLG